MSGLDIGLVAHNVVRRDGQGRVMLELARELVARGHRVTVYAQRRSPELDDLVTDGAVTYADGLGPVTMLTFFAGASRSTRRARHDAVCVMGPCALPPAPFVYYAQFSHAGWQATWASGGAPGAKHRVLSRLGRAMERSVAPRAGRVVACHPDVARQLGVPAPRVVAVPNGIDVDEFPPPDGPRRRAARTRWGLPAEAWVVAFVGEYNTSRKGLDVLVDAVARGRRDEHLVVAGSGDRAALARRAEALGAGDRVHAIGFAEADEVLAAADAAAVPSRYEPFSIVALEAAASRVPLVLSARAGAADRLSGAAVIVDDPEDVAALRRGLDRLREDPGATAALVERAFAVAEALSWPRVAAEAADAVESVVTAGRR